MTSTCAAQTGWTRLLNGVGVMMPFCFAAIR